MAPIKLISPSSNTYNEVINYSEIIKKLINKQEGNKT